MVTRNIEWQNQKQKTKKKNKHLKNGKGNFVQDKILFLVKIYQTTTFDHKLYA